MTCKLRWSNVVNSLLVLHSYNKSWYHPLPMLMRRFLPEFTRQRECKVGRFADCWERGQGEQKKNSISSLCAKIRWFWNGEFLKLGLLHVAVPSKSECWFRHERIVITITKSIHALFAWLWVYWKGNAKIIIHWLIVHRSVHLTWPGPSFQKAKWWGNRGTDSPYPMPSSGPAEARPISRHSYTRYPNESQNSAWTLRRQQF